MHDGIRVYMHDARLCKKDDIFKCQYFLEYPTGRALSTTTHLVTLVGSKVDQVLHGLRRGFGAYRPFIKLALFCLLFLYDCWICR